jgi:D-xylose transport system substrate-binding protein
MRKSFALVMSSLLLFASFAALSAGPVAAQSKADIAVLLPDSASSARWETDDRKYFDDAFKAAGVTYSIVNAQGDKDTQATQADAAISNGAKVILFVDLDSGSGAAIIAKARAAKVAIIDYDRLTIQGGGADFYVSFDGEKVGELQGQGLVDAVHAAGITDAKYAELNGSPTDNNATLFKSGYDKILDPLNGKTDDKGTKWTKIDDQSVPDWDNQKALTIFTQMLTAHPEINAAVAANDGLADAIISAQKNQGLKTLMPVTGQDATVGGIQHILAGEQSMTVYKAIKAEADGAAALAIAIDQGKDTKALATGTVDQTAGGANADGNKAMPAVLLAPISVTKANIASTVIADGFRTWAEICVGDFAQFCPPDAMSGATMSATMSATMAATAAQ